MLSADRPLCVKMMNFDTSFDFSYNAFPQLEFGLLDTGGNWDADLPDFGTSDFFESGLLQDDRCEINTGGGSSLDCSFEDDLQQILEEYKLMEGPGLPKCVVDTEDTIQGLISISNTITETQIIYPVSPVKANVARMLSPLKSTSPRQKSNQKVPKENIVQNLRLGKRIVNIVKEETMDEIDVLNDDDDDEIDIKSDDINNNKVETSSLNITTLDLASISEYHKEFRLAEESSKSFVSLNSLLKNSTIQNEKITSPPRIVLSTATKNCGVLYPTGQISILKKNSLLKPAQPVVQQLATNQVRPVVQIASKLDQPTVQLTSMQIQPTTQSPLKKIQPTVKLASKQIQPTIEFPTKQIQPTVQLTTNKIQTTVQIASNSVQPISKVDLNKVEPEGNVASSPVQPIGNLSSDPEQPFVQVSSTSVVVTANTPQTVSVPSPQPHLSPEVVSRIRAAIKRRSTILILPEDVSTSKTKTKPESPRPQLGNDTKPLIKNENELTENSSTEYINLEHDYCKPVIITKTDSSFDVSNITDSCAALDDADILLDEIDYLLEEKVDTARMSNTTAMLYDEHGHSFNLEACVNTEEVSTSDWVEDFTEVVIDSDVPSIKRASSEEALDLPKSKRRRREEFKGRRRRSRSRSLPTAYLSEEERKARYHRSLSNSSKSGRSSSASSSSSDCSSCSSSRSSSPYDSYTEVRKRRRSSRSPTRSYSSNSSRHSRSRSRSGSWSSRYRTRNQTSSRPRSRNLPGKQNNWRNSVSSLPSYDVRREEQQRRYEKEQKQIEERRVVYVGSVPRGTTKADLKRRFTKFGTIEEITLHFRKLRDNYGFVTFTNREDAYTAIEHGNDPPFNTPRYDLCFGGRRNFCGNNYADLDNYVGCGPRVGPPPRKAEPDFDSLLAAAKAQATKKKP